MALSYDGPKVEIGLIYVDLILAVLGKRSHADLDTGQGRLASPPGLRLMGNTSEAVTRHGLLESYRYVRLCAKKDERSSGTEDNI